LRLEHPGFAATVATTLRTYGLPPSRLVFEVTESTLADPQTPAVSTLHEIRSSGVRIAVDDFGTGYSSLGQLRVLPVDELRIDRSFIAEAVGEPSGTPVLAAIVAMARSLGLELVAEGVETQKQLLALRNLGCGIVQGFLFGPRSPHIGCRNCSSRRPCTALVIHTVTP
jgi:EAL domain-containing protein (putative c-di-GMP-specific phosphodiesterase class I)